MYSHRLNGAHEINQPRALKRALPLQVGSCLKKNLLYPFRFADELPSHGQECRNNTADVRGSHASPAVLDVFALFSLCSIYQQLSRCSRENFLTRSNDVGLHSSIASRAL